MSVRQEDRRRSRKISRAVLVSILCRDEPALSPQLRERILKWMQQSPEHVGDALKADSFVQDLDELKLRNRSAQLSALKPRPRGMTLATRRALLVGGAAVIAMSTGLLLSTLRESNAPVHHLTLTDGSAVHLLRGSDFSVEFDGEVRLLQLASGEAVFEVAKDPGRPFIVRSPTSDSIATGTRFGVVAKSAETTTTVSEGEVRVVPAGADKAAGRTVRAGEEIRVVAGTSQPQPVITVNAERKMLWSAGWLEFDGETVGEAVQAFNRLSDVRVEVTRPELANTRLPYMRFEVAKSEMFADRVAAELNAPATWNAKRTVIYIGDLQL